LTKGSSGLEPRANAIICAESWHLKHGSIDNESKRQSRAGKENYRNESKSDEVSEMAINRSKKANSSAKAGGLRSEARIAVSDC
jgi:hypothetical protein